MSLSFVEFSAKSKSLFQKLASIVDRLRRPSDGSPPKFADPDDGGIKGTRPSPGPPVKLDEVPTKNRKFGMCVKEARFVSV